MIAGVKLFILIGAMTLLGSVPSIFAQSAALKPAVSYPNDGRFLKDRVDFQLVLANQSRPVDVSARPGQMTYFSFPVPGQPEMIRKYALVLMPEFEPGKVAKSYSDLQVGRKSPSTLTVALFCIEEMPAADLLGEPLEAADPNEIGACKARRKDIQLYDDVRFLFRHTGLAIGIENRMVNLGQETGQASVLEGFFDSIRIVSYSSGQGGDSKELVCLTSDGVDVCGCRVAVGSVSSRNYCRE